MLENNMEDQELMIEYKSELLMEPYQELQIYDVQGVVFLQLLSMAFLYLNQDSANIYLALPATFPEITGQELELK